jgi:hypothetical protein
MTNNDDTNTTRKIIFEVNNFVGTFKNAYTNEYCDKVIEEFEKADEAKITFSRQDSEKALETSKKDQSMYSGECWIEHHGLNSTIVTDFFEIFKQTLESYKKKYSALEHDELHVWGNKIQRTQVGGGYHIWHYESSGRAYCNRALAYILYLNDVDEGGETEFLYQHKRIKPEKGTLILFPAAFTHTHRGNPPLSNTKYIATGWVEY